jgi:hypothetical protein
VAAGKERERDQRWVIVARRGGARRGLRLTASMCACAALILAMGTRNGLHDT